MFIYLIGERTNDSGGSLRVTTYYGVRNLQSYLHCIINAFYAYYLLCARETNCKTLHESLSHLDIVLRQIAYRLYILILTHSVLHVDDRLRSSGFFDEISHLQYALVIICIRSNKSPPVGLPLLLILM